MEVSKSVSKHNEALFSWVNPFSAGWLCILVDVYDSLDANCENMTPQFLVVPSKISAGFNFFFSSPG